MLIPQVTAFFDEATNTYSYVVACPQTHFCAVIDSVLDYEAASGRTRQDSANAIIDFIERSGLTLSWILETHVHADHLSAAPYIQKKLGGKLAIGENIKDVQAIFGDLFNAGDQFKRDGSQFDQLFKDRDTFSIGNLTGEAIHTPGHTPACMTYVIGDAAFVGDTLFMPDYGTARADFPGGDASTLYRSIQKIFTLPDQTRLFLCHDYGAPGRQEFEWETSVGEERANNIHIHEGISQEEFVGMRTARDKTLGVPKLILPSVQVNMRGGELPPSEDNGRRYLKIPIDAI